MFEPRPGLRGRPHLITAAVLVAAAILAIGSAAHRPVAAVIAAAAIVTARLDGRARVAAVAGFLVPVEVVAGISENVLLVALIGALLLAGVLHRSTVSRQGLVLLAWFAGITVVLANIQRIELVIDGSASSGIRAMASITVGVAAAAFFACRIEARDAMFTGFLGGVATSSLVAVLQVLDLWSPRPWPVENRGPGLASFTTTQSFNAAAAIFVALYLWHRADELGDRLQAVLFGALCVVGLVVNGAQGGLYAFGIAAVAVAFSGRDRLRRDPRLRRLAAIAAGAVAVVVLVVAVVVGAPSIVGLGGDPASGFANETARLDAARAGVRELIDHPLTGPGAEAFHERHGEAMPHFLPLKAGVLAGVTGFVLGLILVGWLLLLLWRGPVGRAPVAWLGYAVLAVALARTLTTPDGPFGNTHGMTLFLVALLATVGEGTVRSAGRPEAAPDVEAAPRP